MIIRNNTTSKTATRSSVNNRGYERSEHPRTVSVWVTSTLKESPMRADGALFQSAFHSFLLSAGPTDAAVTERRRFQRLGGTILSSKALKR